MAQRRSFRTRIFDYLFLVCCCMLLLRSLAGNRALYWGDILLYFQPMTELMRISFREGRIPLWNPFLLCGQPLLGNPQMGVFYPASLLLSVLPAWRMITVTVSIHVALAGIFSYEFLRRWTHDSESALVGALIYMGSGCLLGRSQFPPMIVAAAYMPLILLLIDRNLDQPRTRSSGGLAVAVGLLLLAAHPQVAYLTLSCASVYAISRCLHQIDQNVSLWCRLHSLLRLAQPLLREALVGLLIAMTQLLPTLQLMLESSREHMTVMQANRFVLQPEQLLTLVFPHFLGHPSTRDYWGAGNVWEPAMFLGWAPLWLICKAISRGFNQWPVRFWATVSVVCIWLAFGMNGGLYTLAFYCVPGVGTFHDPARFLIPGVFALSIVSALGLDAQFGRHYADRRAKVKVWGVLVAIPLIVYAPEWIPTVDADVLAKAGGNSQSQRLAMEQGRLYHPLSEMIWRTRVTAGYTDYGDDGALSMSSFYATMLPNLPMLSGHSSASGYEPVAIRGPLQLDVLAQAELRRGDPKIRTLIELLGVDTMLLPEGIKYGRAYEASPSGRSDSYYVVENYYRTLRTVPIQNRNPFAWIVPQTRRVDGAMRVGAALIAPGFDLRKTAIVSDELGPEDAQTTNADLAEIDPPLPQGDCMQAVQIVQRTSTAFVLCTPRMMRSGMLVIGIAGYPGWYASVDGQERPLHHVDGGLCGLLLPPGQHQVRLWYDPSCYRVGLYISLVSILFLMARFGITMTTTWLPHINRRINGRNLNNKHEAVR